MTQESCISNIKVSYDFFIVQNTINRSIQGCSANSDDGNRQKVVRTSPTMPEKSFALINSFLPKRSNYFFYKRPNMAFKCSLALFSHIKT